MALPASRFSDHRDFSVASRSLYPCWGQVSQAAIRLVALRTQRNRPSFMFALRKAVFHACREHCGAVGS